MKICQLGLIKDLKVRKKDHGRTLFLIGNRPGACAPGHKTEIGLPISSNRMSRVIRRIQEQRRTEKTPSLAQKLKHISISYMIKQKCLLGSNSYARYRAYWNHPRRFIMIYFEHNPSDSSRITSPFGHRINPISKKPQLHKGIDIGRNNDGVNYIYSVACGRVLTQGWNSQRGNYVVIQHDGFATLYQHLNDFRTKIDDFVFGGQVIGSMGDSGASTGIHLHFELYKGRYLNEEYLDPEKYLRKEY